MLEEEILDHYNVSTFTFNINFLFQFFVSLKAPILQHVKDRAEQSSCFFNFQKKVKQNGRG